MMTSTPWLAMPDMILSVTLRVTDRPRAIDEVIDYFGDPPRTRELHPPRALEVAER